MKKLLALALSLGLCLGVLSACQKQDETPAQEPESAVSYPQLEEKPPEDSPIALISTQYGEIKLALYPQYAPKAVENFVTHAKDGYYDGLTFHRIIEDFMIQGGDPKGDGTGGESIWGEGFGEELCSNLRHFRGALCMAKSSLPNSQGSQFYIVDGIEEIPQSLLDQMAEMGAENGWPQEVIDGYKELGGYPMLDHQYTVFGQVLEGLDVVEQICAETPVEDENGTVLPENQPKIDSITIHEASEYFEY